MTYLVSHADLVVPAESLTVARRRAIGIVVAHCVALEAREREHSWAIHDLCRLIGRLPESGGVVGPLPDGTAVSVAVRGEEHLSADPPNAKGREPR